MELETPDTDISNFAKFCVAVKGVGDAHSSDDLKDNITFKERRGITSDKTFKERSIFRLVNDLQKKSKSQMSDEERVRDFQRKIYLKAKQDRDFRFYVLYRRKSQRKCKLYRHKAFEVLVDKYNLIDPSKYAPV